MGARESGVDKSHRPFVGAPRALSEVLAMASLRGQGLLLQVEGTWGIGKTRLYEEVGERVERLGAKPPVTVLQLPVDVLVTPPAVTNGGHEKTGIDRDFDTFTRMLGELCRSKASVTGKAASVEALDALADALDRSLQSVGTPVNVTVDAHDITVSGEAKVACVEALPPAFYENEVARLTTTFARGLNELATSTGLVLLVDGLEAICGGRVSCWLLNLLARLDKATCLVTVRTPPSEPKLYVDSVERSQLHRFGADEVRTCLEQAFPGRPIDDALVARVLEYSGGLPLAVWMAADLIRLRSPDPHGPLVAGELEGGGQRVGDWISAIKKELGDTPVAKLVDAGLSARWMSADLAHYLLFGIREGRGTHSQSAEARTALCQLAQFSFVDRVDAGRIEGVREYAFHEYLRVNSRPRPPGPENKTLADFYGQRLLDYDESLANENGYMRYYKYEQTEWRALMAEWLYHWSRLEDRSAARRQFVSEWLDAFWWMDCYSDMGFCRDLLDEWVATQPDGDRESAAGQCLADILDGYPKGWQKLDAGNWDLVENSIERLRGALGVQAGVPSCNQVQPVGARDADIIRRLKAMTTLLLAHSYRFRTGFGDDAESVYEQALKLIRRLDDPSLLAWTEFERADLAAELGHFAEASARLANAARLVVEETPDDWELRSNVQRLRADIAEGGGDWLTAIHAGVAALLRTMTFLVEPKEERDPYTVAFYQEQRIRLAQRLIRAWSNLSAFPALPDLDRLARLLQMEIPPRSAMEQAIDTGDAETLAGLLTPPPPLPGQVTGTDPLLRACRRICNSIILDEEDEGLFAAQPTGVR